MAVELDAIRRGSGVLVRVPGDKARPAVVIRSDLLAELPYATVLPITSARRADASIRVDIEANPKIGLRVESQVMVDWPPMRAVTRQLAIVLGIGGTGNHAAAPPSQ